MSKTAYLNIRPTYFSTNRLPLQRPKGTAYCPQGGGARTTPNDMTRKMAFLFSPHCHNGDFLVDNLFDAEGADVKS